MICRTLAIPVMTLLLLTASAARSQPVGETALHVSPDGNDAAVGTLTEPLATLEGARDAIRRMRRTGAVDMPVNVYLHGGTYRMAEPFVLTPEDSGTAAHPITYTAYKTDAPRLCGGRKITGWTRRDDGLWVAQLPDVKAGEWRFRQLFVDGRQRPRARTPNEGFLRVAGFPDGGREVHYHADCQRFEFKPGDIDPQWTNLTDVEVIVYHFWTDSHLPIRSIDPATNIVTFKHKAGEVFTDDFTSDGARYIVENVFEGLDQPGEWYLDRRQGTLYYMAAEGEDLRNAEVFAPVAPELIRIEGNAEQREFVEHVAFRNLSFQYTNFELPVGNSNDRQGSASVPAAITLRGARHCAFDHCEIKDLGTSAFEVGEGCSHNRFTSNEISHIAACGFRVGGGSEGSHPLLRTGNNRIVDNQLHHYGENYPSAVGILLMHTAGNTVAHNEIHHGWYTGISIGWQWGYQRSISRDNRIEANHIHHIGQGLLSDMGAVFTLGISPGTVIRGNLIHDVDANHYGGWGIYNDEGSSHLLIDNNIVYWREGPLLAKNWQDKPYTFHFHPKNASGTREEKSTFDMDWNLYFNPNLPVEDVSFNGLDLDEWRRRGKDIHSVYADPRFVDPDGGDFTLKEDSPAWDLGFQPIDLSTVGPRGEPGPGNLE